MKKLPIMLLLLIHAMALVLITCGRDGPLPPPNTTPPQIQSSVPTDGTTGFVLNGAIVITFTKEMNPASINNQTLTVVGAGGIGPVSGTITFSSPSVVLFTPEQNFAPNTGYTVTVDGSVMDSYGILMGRGTTTSFFFMTAAELDKTPPSITYTTPAAGSTDVAWNSSISIEFSEPISTPTLTVQLQNLTTMSFVTGTMNSSGTTAIFTPQFTPPAVSLDGNTTYQATVKAGLQDTVGNPMASDFTWTFTTTAGPDIIAPTATALTPTAGATDVSVTTYVTASFSEPVNQTTVVLTLFSTSTGTAVVVPYIFDDYDYGRNILSYKPTTDFTLEYNTKYTARVSGVQDLAGNAMPDMTWSFTTTQAATSLSLFASDRNMPYGTPITFTATVSSDASSTVHTPTGRVTFKDNNADVSNGTVALSGNTAAFTISTLTLGSHIIIATYNGDAIFSTSTASVEQTVGQGSTTTTITAPGITYGSNGMVTVTVSSGSGIPIGNVSLSVDSGPTTTQALSSGSTVFNVGKLSVGDHTLSATYTGQGNFLGSTGSGSLGVGQGTTTTMITAPTVTYGANGVVTVLVSSASGTPTGNVSLNWDTGTATLALNGNGSATFTITGPAAGVHPLTASYAVQGSFLDSTGTGNLTVNQAPTTMTISAPVIAYGANGIVTVTVNSGMLLPTGNVSLVVDNGTPILGALSAGSGAGGVATFTIIQPIAGSHTLSATYAAQGNFGASSAPNGSLGVGAGATTTTITAPTITYGSNGAVTVTVTSPSGVPVGNVSLRVDSGPTTTQALTNGSTVFTVSSPVAGNHTLSATYAAQGSYLQSSTSGNLLVNLGATTTVISAPTITYGANGAVTVTIISTSGTPTGSVSFSVDGVAATPQTLVNGSAAFTITHPGAGSHTLTATYAAQGNFGSSSAPGSLLVNQAATTTSITAPAITYGANGAVTVSVISSSGTPTGSVSFSVDGVAATPQTLVNGSTIFTITSPSSGSHTLSATYAAQGYFGASSASGSLAVGSGATSMTISAPTITYGANGSVGVTVLSSSGTPTGNVTLSVDGGTPTSQLLSNGTATFTITSPSAPSHSLSATYAAQGNFLGSGPTSGTLTVNPAATTTAISAPGIGYGSNGIVNVTVTSGILIPVGNVSLVVDNGTPILGTLSSGSATFTITAPSAGNHTLSATFAAQGNFLGSGPTAGTLSVGAGATTTSINAPAITFGANGTVGVTVISSSGTPTGNVTLSVDGGTPTSQLLSNGTATFTITNPSTPSHTLSASYAAQGNFLASGPISGTLTVNKASSSTSVQSSTNPSVYGDSVTFTATVITGATGSVTFNDGATVIGSGTLSGSTPNTATFSTTSLTVATHNITATYNGDSNYGTSASSNLQQFVTKASSATSLGLSPNPSTYGQSVTFTATVAGSGSGAVPTGTVMFKVDSTTIGSGTLAGGVASFSTSTLAAPFHTITAVYNGDTSYLTSQDATSQTVNKADQTITFGSLGSVSYSTGSLTLGATASSGLAVTYTSSDLNVATISGNIVTFVNPLGGTVMITAQQAGNSDYNPAADVPQSLTITP